MFPSRAKKRAKSRVSNQTRERSTSITSLIKEETLKTCKIESQYKTEQGCPPVPHCEVPQTCCCSPCTCSQTQRPSSSGGVSPFASNPSPKVKPTTGGYTNIPSLVSNESTSKSYLPSQIRTHNVSKLSYAGNANIWRGWRQWKPEKLSATIHSEVGKLFAGLLPMWGLNTQLLLKLNQEMTYGLIGTPFVGNEKDLQTAAILYPNVGNMVFENGTWKELDKMRMVLTASRIEGLFRSIANLAQSKFSFSEAIVSLFHEFMHALIRKTKCAGNEIALSAEKQYTSANENLAQALTEVILAKAKSSQRELTQTIQQAKSLGGTKCLELLLQNKNQVHFIPEKPYQSKGVRSHKECGCQGVSKSHQETQMQQNCPSPPSCETSWCWGAPASPRGS